MKNKKIEVNDCVQFIEHHKWKACFGYVDRIAHNRIMVGVPIPKNNGNTEMAYIYCKAEDIEVIGKAVLAPAE